MKRFPSAVFLDFLLVDQMVCILMDCSVDKLIVLLEIPVVQKDFPGLRFVKAVTADIPADNSWIRRSPPSIISITASVISRLTVCFRSRRRVRWNCRWAACWIIHPASPVSAAVSGRCGTTAPRAVMRSAVLLRNGCLIGNMPADSAGAQQAFPREIETAEDFEKKQVLNNSRKLWLRPETRNSINRLAQNAEMLDSYARRDGALPSYEMLLITPQSYVESFNDYVALYAGRGIRIRIASTQDIYSAMQGRDNKEKIQQDWRNGLLPKSP